MTVELPTKPRQSDMTFTPVDYGGLLSPATGAGVQRLNRNGNRWSVGVQLPIMRVDDARAWIAALTRGLRDGVKFYIHQVDFAIGAPGNLVVDGAGQAGVTLSVAGATAQYAFRVGQWITITTDGQGYLYMIAAQSIANATGDATLTIEPPLRAEPADGDTVAAGQPFIEGSLASGGVPWTIDVARTVGLSFTITEDQ